MAILQRVFKRLGSFLSFSKAKFLSGLFPRLTAVFGRRKPKENGEEA
jgi:hypothetical protein